MSDSHETSRVAPGPAQEQSQEPACRLANAALAAPGEVYCPVCYAIIPPEQIGHKLHCRRCGYLESCCNPY